MTVIPPRYEVRENNRPSPAGTLLLHRYGVWDTVFQKWAWRADKVERFIGLDEAAARAQSDALNRIYERAL